MTFSGFHVIPVPPQGIYWQMTIALAPTTSIPVAGVTTDAALLAAFAVRRDQSAFAEIARRHAGMVLAVARSVLGNTSDADDAAQAVFLTLAQKASSRHVQNHLVGWLHRVAWYVAARAATAGATRRRHEQEAARMNFESATPTPETIPPDLLHASLADLPEKYRTPLLLHHIEGHSQEATAALLGCAVSAAAMRLSRGRVMLRERLIERGAALASTSFASSFAAALAAHPVAVAPASFISLASKSAAAIFAQQVAASVVISPSTLALSKGALHMLFWTKLKFVALSTAAALILAGGALGAYVKVANAAAPQYIAATAPATGKQTITGVAKGSANSSVGLA